MGADPASSVVDEQLRVRGKPNCFVLGSSVYPSVGTANPDVDDRGPRPARVPAIKKSLTS